MQSRAEAEQTGTRTAPARARSAPASGGGPAHDEQTDAAAEAHVGRLAGLAGAGQPMPASSRAALERTFGRSLGDVRIHDDARAAATAAHLSARAFTVGRHIGFGRGAYRPGTIWGDALLAHEAAHTLQQRHGGPAAEGAAEQDADRAAAAAALGTRHAPGGGARGLRLQRCDGRGRSESSIDEAAAQAAEEARRASAEQYRQQRNELFHRLRTESRPLAPERRQVLQAAVAALQPGSDDQWLGEQLLAHGAEPLWPQAALDERHRRSQTWDSDPIIEGVLGMSSPTPGEAGTGRVAPMPIRAYYVPGRSAERALVIGGVHGSELSGIEAVERLLTDLRRPGAQRPYYTTIIVPELFPQNAETARRRRARRGYPRGSSSVGRYLPVQRGGETVMVEPNRNYPLRGQSLAAAQAGGLRDPQHPKQRLEGDHAIDTVLPETAALLELIERFRPVRIASVHAHRPGTRQGDAPGFFVDPRGGVDRDRRGLATRTRTAEGRTDDALAQRMMEDARTRGLTGLNPADDIHYSERPGIHPEGTSLGDWAPAAGITTVTVEVRGYAPSDADTPHEDAARATEIQGYADVMRTVFLAGP